MKPTTRATTVLLVATIAAVGCSKKGATSQEKTGAPVSTQASVQSPDPSKPIGLGEDDVAADTTPRWPSIQRSWSELPRLQYALAVAS